MHIHSNLKYFANSLLRSRIVNSITTWKTGFRRGLTMRISRFILAAQILLFAEIVWAQENVRDEARFVIVSIRQMSHDEATRRNGDCIECSDLAVRIRLETGQYGIRFYGWPDDSNPVAFTVDRTGSRTVWMHGMNEKNWPTSSPGIKELLFGGEGRWILLQPHSAVEWEILDSTHYAGSVHAFTIFVRDGPKTDRRDREVISPTFTVPERQK